MASSLEDIFALRHGQLGTDEFGGDQVRFSRPTIARPGLGWAHRAGGLEASNHFSVFGAAEADKKVTIGWRQ